MISAVPFKRVRNHREHEESVFWWSKHGKLFEKTAVLGERAKLLSFKKTGFVSFCLSKEGGLI